MFQIIHISFNQKKRKKRSTYHVYIIQIGFCNCLVILSSQFLLSQANFNKGKQLGKPDFSHLKCSLERNLIKHRVKVKGIGLGWQLGSSHFYAKITVGINKNSVHFSQTSPSTVLVFSKAAPFALKLNSIELN